MSGVKLAPVKHVDAVLVTQDQTAKNAVVGGHQVYSRKVVCAVTGYHEIRA